MKFEFNLHVRVCVLRCSGPRYFDCLHVRAALSADRPVAVPSCGCVCPRDCPCGCSCEQARRRTSMTYSQMSFNVWVDLLTYSSQLDLYVTLHRHDVARTNVTVPYLNWHLFRPNAFGTAFFFLEFLCVFYTFHFIATHIFATSQHCVLTHVDYGRPTTSLTR